MQRMNFEPNTLGKLMPGQQSPGSVPGAMQYFDYTHSLLKDYIQKMVDDGKMMRLRDIKKMDILDMTGFLNLPDDGYSLPDPKQATEEELDTMCALNWYIHVPCFEKGAIRVNKFRYIVFEVLEMDPENCHMKIKLTDYSKADGIQSGIWQKGVSTTVVTEMRNKDEEDHYVGLKLIEKQTFEQLYTMYSAKDLGWGKSDYKQWMDTIVANAREKTKQIEKRTGIDQCGHLVNAYMAYIGICNAILTKNKPSRPVKKQSSGKRKVSYEKGVSPERKIRNVGPLRVQSKDIPRKPCLETVITYKTAKWKVRGHIRHYRSGKEVYIKPTTRTRKALADTDKVTATTIRFNKKKGT